MSESDTNKHTKPAEVINPGGLFSRPKNFFIFFKKRLDSLMFIVYILGVRNSDAESIIRAIDRRERDKQRAEREAAAERERAELEYYEENNCYPRPAGYLGAETDAHFYER